MAGTKRVLCLTPQQLEKGEEPASEVNGYHGGVLFEEGVSEPISHTEAQQFAARGNVVLDAEKAERVLAEIRGEKSENGKAETARALADLSPADLEEAALPDGWDPPLYQEAYSELSEEVEVRSFFGGQPQKLPLLKLYYAWKHGPGELFDD